jgi:hypothetical protein
MEFGFSFSGDNCMLIARCLYLAGDGPRPVRAGSAWRLSSGRSVRRGSGVMRDFACTFTWHLLPVCVVLRSQSCLRSEGRARTLSGPSPDLSPARTLAPSSRCEDLLIRSSMCGHPDPFRSVRDLGLVAARCSSSPGFPKVVRHMRGLSHGHGQPWWLASVAPRRRVHGSGGRLSHLANLCDLPAWTRLLTPGDRQDHSAHIPDHGNWPRDRPHRAGDDPRPVRAGSDLALGLCRECP